MKHIKLGKDCYDKMTYPVGFHMHSNLPAIIKMGQELDKYLSDRLLNENSKTNIHLICSGSSGSIISSIIYTILETGILKNNLALSANILYVKKNNEKSLYSSDITDAGYYCSNINNSYFIYIDDFITSGATFDMITNKMVNLFGSFKYDIILTTKIPKSLYKKASEMTNDVIITYINED